MQRLYLKFPAFEDKESVLNFKEEFVSSGQKMAGVGGLDELESFEEWLDKITNEVKKENCKEGRVPATLYLVYRIEDDKLVGMVQIRHELNEYLFQFGGHIGDCIRPSEQGKGYATEQIGLALEKCKEMGLDRVLITCNKSNFASARTIVKNNGELENEVKNNFENGEIMQRYWIKLK